MKEIQIRNYIRKIIKEQNEENPQGTEKLKGGRYKKEIEDVGKVPPGELMQRLNAKKGAGDSDIKKLVSFLGSATGGVEAMKIVYDSPKEKKDSQGRFGAEIPLSSIKGAGGTIPPRDGRRYIQYTMAAGKNSGYIDVAPFVVEIFGNGVLVYFSDKPYMWNRASQKKKKSVANESFLESELLGEPDESNQDEREDDDKDEFNVSANVAGVITPLGTGPTGGKGKEDKENSPRKRAIDANERAFGGGKVYSPKKK